MQATTDGVGNVSILQIPCQKIDARCREEFQAELDPLLSEPGANVVIDMSDVRFIDSAGIGALIWGLKRATKNNGSLRLCNVAKPIRAVFEMAQLHRLFEIFDTREEAVAAFEPS